MIFNTISPGGGGGGGSASQLRGIIEGTLSHLDVPDGTTWINTALTGSALQTITIPDSVEGFTASAFKDCTNLQSIEIPSAVTTLYEWTFDGCTSLASVTFHEGLTELEDQVFGNCIFTSIDLPSTLTTLGMSAFYECEQLQTVTVRATTPPSITDEPFYGSTRLTAIYVPSASVSAYKSAWSDYASIIQSM